ncbi:MAG: hypothetical protein ACWGOY_08165 [Anaerolineales bacterium]
MKLLKNISWVGFILTCIFLISLFPESSKARQTQTVFANLPLVFNNYVKGFSNPGFENGSEGWFMQSNQGDNLVTAETAHTGSYSAALGNGNGNRIASISQQVIVPQQVYVVQYFQLIQSLEDCPGSNQLMVYVNNQPYQHYSICQDDDSQTWEKFRIYLAPDYRGKSVEIRLTYTSGVSSDSSLYVDDFSFDLP